MSRIQQACVAGGHRIGQHRPEESPTVRKREGQGWDPRAAGQKGGRGECKGGEESLAGEEGGKAGESGVPEDEVELHSKRQGNHDKWPRSKTRGLGLYQICPSGRHERSLPEEVSGSGGS